MKLSYPVLVALRYLKSRKRHKSISFNAVISIGGVAVGVMALIIVLAVMSGFHQDLQRKILGVNAHIIMTSRAGKIPQYESLTEDVKKVAGVASAAPFVLGQVMAARGRGAQGIFLRGIIPDREKAITGIYAFIKEGRLESLSNVHNGIVIGRELANNIGVTLNDELNIISPMGEIGPLGMLPKTRKFKVVAIFEVGMYEYDSSLAVTSIDAAQDFFDLRDSATGIEVRMDDIYQARQVRQRINDTLGYPYHARDWMQMNKNLFSALKLEKLAMFVILTLIVLVAAFNIISTLIMSVIEKERDIAILKTMGATNAGIMYIFMLQGFIIGLVGTLIGLVGGSLTCYVLDTYELIKLPADVYYLSRLPVKVNVSDFTLVSVSAIVISFLSTIYPAYQAANVNPIEPLRFE
ncbi:lipoprotein-releasing ABC transporter permease subunit [Candidatus Magnetobacterium casense]|uniref:lipoprotein-releasing ABC transporter permease subunit n=1 Tax=Candidatus Magnetobacterium casense TaxID=1455061 RepID=UPI00058F7875|nr:lipoprotein-releasing ABC transporter permease subunit [Candidatus Magnetobacterium casensis]